MVLDYAAPHENFVWQIRSEPGVVETFEKVHGTRDLIVSFDAINIGGLYFPVYKDCRNWS